jgi:hypothetical protein
MYNKVLTHEGYSRGGIKWLRRLQCVSCNQLGNRVVVRGRGVSPSSPTPFYSRPKFIDIKTTYLFIPPPRKLTSRH